MHIRQNSIVKALRVVKHVNSGTIEPVTTMCGNRPLPLPLRYSDRYRPATATALDQSDRL